MSSRSLASGVALILFAVTLWGLSGVPVRLLLDDGMSPLQVVYYTNLLALPIQLALLLLVAPHTLRVAWRALPGVLLVGVVGGSVGFILYVNAVGLTSVSLATLLLYTSPAWVALLGWRFLGEAVTRRRLVAVGLAFLGCALAARVYDPAGLRLDLLGVLLGLASGLCWALWNVFGKQVLETQHPLTVALYGTLGSTLLLVPLQPSLLPTTVPAGAWFWLLAFAIGAGVIGLVAFNVGLRLLPAGLVSLLSMWELVVALVAAALVLDERLELVQALGALLLVASVLVLQPSLAAADQPARATAA